MLTIIKKLDNRYSLYLCSGCNIESKFRTDGMKHRKSKVCSSCRFSEKWSKTRLFSIFHDMKKRCYNENSKSYDRYGGRGITVCSDWLNNPLSFKEWALANGYDENLSIDRIDNDGNYEPNNCRWTTQSVQAQNTRRLRKSNTSGYRGVCFNKPMGMYYATISISNKRQIIHKDKSAKECAIRRDEFIINNGLEHTLNFKKEL